MKRPLVGVDSKMKKIKVDPEDEEEVGGGVSQSQIGFTHLDENLLFEVLKHVDARTLARAGCVSKLWHRTSQDERLWELICTKHWANIDCANRQLRSVVLALGGFRRLHSLYLLAPVQTPVVFRFAFSFGSRFQLQLQLLGLGFIPANDQFQAANAVGKR